MFIIKVNYSTYPQKSKDIILKKKHHPVGWCFFLCKDSFVNTMNTKMSISVHNDGRLVFTFTNGSEETVMM